MDAMMFQEVLMLVISVAGLAGGTACIIRRENRSNGNSDKRRKESAQSVEFVPQSHTA